MAKRRPLPSSRGSRRRRVALAVPQGPSFIERILHGFIEHGRTVFGWTFTRLPEELGTSVSWLRDWDGDGALATIVSTSDAKIAVDLPYPVVNISSRLQKTGLPTVAVDHAEIGRLAARHLLDRNFRRFGYYGPAGFWFSRLRRDGFRDAVEEAGGECSILEAQSSIATQGWRDQQGRLESWLRGLQAPLGVLAATDLRASMVLQACRQVGLKVPDDVAVIGVDNDPVVAAIDDPPLTSVSRNDEQVGREAAMLLATLMDGGTAPQHSVFIPSSGVIQRQSTQTVAVEDPMIADAIRYIRENVGARFGVEQLLKAVPLSRRSLECRFRNAIGSSPYDFINATRVENAKRMLRDAKKPKLSTIAAASGFSDVRRFRLVFYRVMGCAPSDYRNANSSPRTK